MNNVKKQNKMIFSAALLMISALLMSGCGGGGTSQPAASAGSGRVGAIVKLTGRTGGRSAAQSASETVNVTVTISGIYSVDNTEFAPVSTVYPVNIAQGYARVTLLKVPVGVNHLLVAVANWGGATETIKAIIPKVSKDTITLVTVDEASTVVADTAIYYAQQQSTTLSEIPQDTIDAIAAAVASFSEYTSYSNMTPQQVLTYQQNMNIPGSIVISPHSLAIVTGDTSQFSAQIFDLNHTLLSASVTSWAFSPGNVGAISNTGLFTAATAGTGTVSVAYQSLSASANVTVITVCKADSDCNDGRPLTIDNCNNPGALNGSCSHTSIACNTNGDCNDNIALTVDTCANGGTVNAACSNTQIACNDGLDCNDNNDLTIDVCSSGGTAGASCGHTTIACNINIDCNDSNALTIDACSNGGTAGASCGHTAFACNSNTDCNDNVTSTIDVCVNGGAVNASCTHTPAGSVGIDVFLNPR